MSAPESTARAGMNAVLSEIAEKRLRQMQHHGFMPEHDDRYRHNELPAAAACYALVAARPQMKVHYRNQLWPWADHWLRDGTPRELLVNAAALIVAEIERLDRAARQAEQERSDG